MPVNVRLLGCAAKLNSMATTKRKFDALKQEMEDQKLEICTIIKLCLHARVSVSVSVTVSVSVRGVCVCCVYMCACPCPCP